MTELLSFFSLPQQHSLNILGVDFALKVTYETMLLIMGFSLSLLAANFYFRDSKNELFLCNLYTLSSILCIVTNDFISMFIALELMMLFASGILLYRNQMIAGQYFIIHLISGSFVMLGISLIINKPNAGIITPGALETADMQFAYLVILVGLIINTAAVPFSGWVTACYPSASNSTFLYLITFTTKVSCILTFKLFSGLYLLQIFGVIGMLIGAIYSMLEEDTKKSICYVSISQLGFILSLIGSGVDSELFSIYIFTHILYTMLFIVALFNKSDKTLLLRCSLIFSLAMIVNFPFSASFLIKTQASLMLDSYSLYASYLSNIFIIAAVIKQVLKTSDILEKNKLLIIPVFVLFVPLLVANMVLLKNYSPDFMSILKQMVVIMLGGILGIFAGKIRISLKSYYLFAPIQEYFKLGYPVSADHAENYNVQSLKEIVIGYLDRIKPISQKTAIATCLILLFIINLLLLEIV
jgi:NADH:ubiquinone oxidoreductase subunit 4 (subunit M)